jgi:hypothetical protein
LKENASTYEDKGSDALPSKLKIIRGFEQCRPCFPYALQAHEHGEQLGAFLEIVLRSKWTP